MIETNRGQPIAIQKGAPYDDFMTKSEDPEFSLDEQIKALMKSKFDWASTGLLGTMPFDISKPNFHDNKSDFLHEKETIQKIVDHLVQVIELSLDLPEETKFEKRQLSARLEKMIDASAIELAPTLKISMASDLARKNVMETRCFVAFVRIAVFHVGTYRRRLEELEYQEQQYWDVRGRPPNYYARTISLRFARFFARKTGKMPTFGTSSEGSHPSTEYGRILEEIFRILGIEGGIRGPAKWAISQITDDDLKPTTEPPEVIRGGGLSQYLTGGLRSFVTEESILDP